MQTLRTFGWSFGATALGLVVALLAWGPAGLAAVGVLAVLEVSLSFDNAVVNATVLRRMNALWQKIFLTIGILIAVFGMRLLFPLVVVSATTGDTPASVLDMAINRPDTYAEHLEHANAAIAAFGGIFLLMIALDFFLDEERPIRWLRAVEGPLARAARLDRLSVLAALAVLATAAQLLAGPKQSTVLLAGVLGLVTYLAVDGLSQLFQREGDRPESADESPQAAATPRAPARGRAAFFLFLYLEVLDASFSFDGVIGAFAISQNIFQIALGLGIGAMYIRSLTVHLVRQGTLDSYVYLEHGAHYAIGALGVILVVSIRYDVPQAVTGAIGVAFILVAFLSSLARNRRTRRTAVFLAPSAPPAPAGPEPAPGSADA
ncbi:DUF475 domain-containing protein [Streptomyces albogriseolus]|uniref:Integral membrane protein n=2 Tax=unclassified Streptomyces TaxID=2593676 RepID=V9Z5S2_9ACTN|nr:MULTISPECIES: DUF475 domain-containing protein [unclassified Streptomyces]AHE38979.1 Integral membrane protein [Streptomyces sp. FR1]AHE39463.1 Integral membrane protein [Streptomyces sp. F2]